MKLVLLLPGLFAVALLAGCAESSPAPDNTPAAAISMPNPSDNPPVTMSGYVDTSMTTQIK